MYTDGLKEGDKVAAAAIVNNDIFSIRLQNEKNIYRTCFLVYLNAFEKYSFYD